MSDTDSHSTETSATETTEQAAETAAAKTKTYTKAEVDGMLKKQGISIRREYGDVGELRQKAEQFDALQESSKTETEKERSRADKAVRERDAALTRGRDTLIRASIISAASRLGVVDPEAVAALLPRDDILVEGDEVLGVEEAVKALLLKKPYLRAQGATRGGSEMTGSGQEPVIITRSQIKRWARGEDGGLTAARQTQITEAQRAGRIAADR